ncbi:MAG TPA: cyanophycin synthetase, partial [Pseudomonadales bacterium]
GRHNVLNALAAIAVATDENLADDAILAGLEGFTGVGRRFQTSDAVALNGKTFTVVDDYGHHPTEVEAVIQTARAIWPQRRLVMLYQPHRYTRTRDLFDDFVRVLTQVDMLICLEVYAAGEAPIPGADSRSLCQGIRQRANLIPVYAEDPDDALGALADIVESGDVVLVQGAGNVNRISNQLTGAADG